jgi:preprotein translocase subunit Sec61beta
MADQVGLPSGSGGFMRYFDDFKSKIELTPELVVIVCGVVILIEIVLHYGFSL